MFAGEGDAFRTNRRFHLLSEGQPATRLSTAFDSVTLYGRDPGERPDIYGKVGTSGVSIATLDDMKVLYGGFDLCAPTTSVSMTINGPAPTILAFFLNTAIDQQLDAFTEREGRAPDDARGRRASAARVLRTVRGTVQADILKEDQGQNTCIFSTEFSLRMMADIAEWFIEQRGPQLLLGVDLRLPHRRGRGEPDQPAGVHAGQRLHLRRVLPRPRHGHRRLRAQPVVLLLQRHGRRVHRARPGRPPHLGRRHARPYGANDRSQKLKYHVQTSGRSLHAQEMAFNDIRTTLQALNALYDNCNSLHTNAYDEAVTTPSAESVRRALAIQLIINREWGLSMNENPLQGSFIVDELTDLVEEAVLAEFDRITERGGVLGAMETGYQRGRIQDESMLYEQRKHDGTLPIIGVNTFRAPTTTASTPRELELARGTEAEKQSQLDRLRDFQPRHRDERRAGARRAAGRRSIERRQRLRRADGRRAGVLARRRSPTPSSRSAASTAATSDAYPLGVYSGGMNATYQVTGMTCGHCELSVREEVAELTGVDVIEVSHETGRLVVSAPDAVDDAAVLAAVDEAGYAAVRV